MGALMCRPKRSKRPLAKVLFLGLKDSGKTTALHYLKTYKSAEMKPTHGCITETLEGRYDTVVWDVSGALERREQFIEFLKDTDGVAFFLDCNTPNIGDLNKAFKQIRTFLKEDSLQKIPIAIAANKQDRAFSRHTGEVTDALKKRKSLDEHVWKVFPVSAWTGEGLNLMMYWLETTMTVTDPKAKAARK